MSAASDQKKLLKSIRFYEEFLKTVSEDTFVSTPPGGGWSYAEVYSHIFGSNQLSVIAAEKCLNKTADVKTRKPHWKVRLILFMGQLPPGKYVAPKILDDMAKKTNKEDAANQLVKIKKKLADLYPNFKKFNPDYKVKHPRLGFLDAKSWLRFMLIHTKHHEKQIGRIEKDFKNPPANLSLSLI